MCGFLGCFGELPSVERRRTGLKQIELRGPDAEGVFENETAWIGFRRLSIQDLSEHGDQPMTFDEGRYVLVFNGEIYNHHDLRQTHLEGVAHQSTGDTEVLGQMLERLPLTEVLPLLRGMFAFLWFDTKTGELLAARDRFGIKPLYYQVDAKKISLASELKSLIVLEKEVHVDRHGLASFLASGSVASPSTMIEGLHCLQPGHFLRWSLAKSEDGVQIEKWHILKWKPKSEWLQGGMPAWREETRERVFDSIRAHLVSDVEVGVFLSGGIDSSLVACAMKHVGHEKLKAFSVGYEQDSGVPDESSVAERTAKHLGAKFSREIVTSDSLFEDFDSYIAVMDQPTGDALNTYLASKVAGREVKVVMSGVGVDEWFGGYRFHRAFLQAENAGLLKLPGRRVGAAALLQIFKLLPAGLKKRGAQAQYFAELMQECGLRELQLAARTFFNEDDLLRNGFWAREIQRDRLGDDWFKAVAPDSFSHQLYALETESFLQNTLLRDADWASMSQSIELRTPFVDQGIFELSAMLPPEAKLTPKINKRVFRECFTDILPEWITADQKKKTFTLPKSKWMRERRWYERIQDVLRSESFESRGILKKATLAATLDDFHAARQAHKHAAFVRDQKIWMLFILEEWLRCHLDSVNKVLK